MDLSKWMITIMKSRWRIENIESQLNEGSVKGCHDLTILLIAGVRIEQKKGCHILTTFFVAGTRIELVTSGL